MWQCGLRSWSQLPHQPSLLATFQALSQNRQTKQQQQNTHKVDGPWDLNTDTQNPSCLCPFCSSVREHLDCLLLARSSRHILRQISTSFSFWWAFGEAANCFQFKMRAVRDGSAQHCYRGDGRALEEIEATWALIGLRGCPLWLSLGLTVVRCACEPKAFPHSGAAPFLSGRAVWKLRVCHREGFTEVCHREWEKSFSRLR